MKTYSRKKSIHTVKNVEIAEFEEMCRLCLSQEGDMVDIYNEDEAIPLQVKILSCLSLVVLESDGYPYQICEDCLQHLNMSYQFKQKCMNSDKLLQQMVKHKLCGQELPMLEANEEAGDLLQMPVCNSDTVEGINTEESHEQREDISEDISFEQAPETEILPHLNPYTVTQNTCNNTTVSYNTMQTGNAEIISNNDNQSNNLNLPNSEAELQNEFNNQPVLEEGDHTIMNTENERLEPSVEVPTNSGAGTHELNDVNVDSGCAIPPVPEEIVHSVPGRNRRSLRVKKEVKQEPQDEDTFDSENNLKGKCTTLQEGNINAIIPTNRETAAQSRVHHESKCVRGLPFLCEKCPKRFAKRIELKRHSSVHNAKRGVECPVCEKWFPSRTSFARHERSHTGERPYSCPTCHKAFSQSAILGRHLLTHSGEKPHGCDVCGRRFTQREGLRAHMRQHSRDQSDIQQHDCPLCEKSFCHPSGLSRHLLVHTGKTFDCDSCGKSFTDSSSLKRHVKRHNKQ